LEFNEKLLYLRQQEDKSIMIFDHESTTL